jgi:hypothetical protein
MPLTAARAFLFRLEFFMADFIPVRQLRTLDTNQKNRQAGAMCSAAS